MAEGRPEGQQPSAGELQARRADEIIRNAQEQPRTSRTPEENQFISGTLKKFDGKGTTRLPDDERKRLGETDPYVADLVTQRESIDQKLKTAYLDAKFPDRKAVPLGFSSNYLIAKKAEQLGLNPYDLTDEEHNELGTFNRLLTKEEREEERTLAAERQEHETLVETVKRKTDFIDMGKIGERLTELQVSPDERQKVFTRVVGNVADNPDAIGLEALRLELRVFEKREKDGAVLPDNQKRFIPRSRDYGSV